MSARMTVAEFENNLEGLQGAILYFAKNNEVNLLLDITFPDLVSQTNSMKSKLEKIDMFESVKIALAQAEELTRQAEYDQAADAILEINRALMKASGTWDRLVKRFPPKSK